MNILIGLLNVIILLSVPVYAGLKLAGVTPRMIINEDKESKMIKKYKKTKDLKVLKKAYFSDRLKVIFDVIDNLEDYSDEVESVNQLQNSILLYLNSPNIKHKHKEGSSRDTLFLYAYEDLVLNAYRNVKQSRMNAREDLVDMTDKALAETRKESARLTKEEA